MVDIGSGGKNGKGPLYCRKAERGTRICKSTSYKWKKTGWIFGIGT